MKKHIVGIALSICCNVQAMDILSIYSVISCNSVADKGFFQQEFAKSYGPPIKDEEGALWFKGVGELYDSPIREFFVSNTKQMSFVGVVLEEPPNIIAERIKKYKLYPTNVFPTNGYWVGSDGRNIMWHKGKYTKIFCNVSYNAI
jgi:hypothetical protein